MRRAAVVAVVVGAVLWPLVARAQGEMKHRAYLPMVRVDPTPTAVPYWWDEACRGKTRRELIVNGGFEDNDSGVPWTVVSNRWWGLSNVAPIVQSAVVHSGRRAISIPPKRGARVKSAFANGVPVVRFAAPGSPGPRIYAARMRIWWMYQTNQPDSYEDDRIEAVQVECQKHDDGTVSFYGLGGWMDFGPGNWHVNRRDANRWTLTELDVLSDLEYDSRGAPGFRLCPAISITSVDDDEPAAFYFDDISLEVCE